MKRLSLVQRMTRVKFVPPRLLLQFYPPFLFMGVKIKVFTKDHRRMVIQLPLRWYGKNVHGTMFGGFLCAVSDPLPALLCGRIFRGVEVWTKSHAVEFIRPAKTSVEAEVVISDEDVAAISEALNAEGKTSHTFRFSFRDEYLHEIATVANTVYFRKRAG